MDSARGGITNRREFLLAGMGMAPAVVGSGPSSLMSMSAAPKAWKGNLDSLFKPGPYEISLMASGDSILYRSHDELHGPGFDELFQVQKECNLAVTNCETVFTNKGYPKPKDMSRARTEIADSFVWQGIDMVSLANNHSMDLGAEGLFENIKALEERKVIYAGGGKNIAEATKPGIVTLKGIKVGLLSYGCFPTLGGSNEAVAAEDRPGLVFVMGFPVRVANLDSKFRRFIAPEEASLKAMESVVLAARKQVDFLMIAFHWHWGPRNKVDEGRKIITHVAIDNGADLVFGHGPHVINPAEIYNRKPIFYSLGNFFFHIVKNNTSADFFGPNWPIRRHIFSFTTSTDFWEGLAPRFIIGKNGVHRVQVLPIFITRDGNPRFPDPEHGIAIIEDFMEMCEYENMCTDFKIRDWYAELFL